MKTYKLAKTKQGLRNPYQIFENILNQYARECWLLKHVDQGWVTIILDYDKNR